MHKGKCQFCEKMLIVLPTKSGSALPVEFDDKQVYDKDTVYDYRIHKSHLLHCTQQRNAWVSKKKAFIKMILPSISPKELHR